MNAVKLAGIIAMAGILCQTGKYEARDMRDVQETRDWQGLQLLASRLSRVSRVSCALSLVVDAVVGGHGRDAGRRGRGSRPVGGSSRRSLRRVRY